MHELEVFENGAVSIRDLRVGEAMHSSIGPLAEATQVYIIQTELARRLCSGVGAVVLYDVGMGIAANVVAAIECHAQLPTPRPLHIVSFENSPEGIRTALGHPAQFPWLMPYSSAIEELLRTGRWESADGKIVWELRTGDFRKQDLSPAPEVIFYDFFSPKSSPELWEQSVFERIFAACAPNAILATYSAATRVRKAMENAGFQVTKGLPTQAKRETTVARNFMSASR